MSEQCRLGYSHLDTCYREENELPGLITLNLYLPSSNVPIPTAQVGISMIQALKSHHVYRRIPLVTLGWSARGDERMKALNYSTNLCVPKPGAYAGWGLFISG